jgi:hypothetical protein
LTLVYYAQYDRARPLLERSLLLDQEREDQLMVSLNLSNLGLLALRRGRLDEARSLFTRSLRLKRDLGPGPKARPGPLSTGAFTAVGNMVQGRSGHTATLLPDGRVLIAGGYSTGGPQATAELFDPAPGTFQKPGSMKDGRYRHAAVALPDGRVAILGGGANNRTLSGVEIYDPQTGAFTQQGILFEARGNMTAHLLPDGRILVTGGTYRDSNGNPAGARKSAEIYDPATGQSATTGATTDPRAYHSASPLLDGRILVTGGWTGSASVRSADLIDPLTGKVSPTVPMSIERAGQAQVSIIIGFNPAASPRPPPVPPRGAPARARPAAR